MSKTAVDIVITIEEIKNKLMRHLDIKQGDKVADVIIGHMIQSKKGMSHLFKALMGEFPSLKYEVGDFIWVKEDFLSSWRYELQKMKQLPNYNDGEILAQITKVNIYDHFPYTVTFDAIKTNETTVTQEQGLVDEQGITEKAEDFTDILDQLEKLRDDQELPF